MDLELQFLLPEDSGTTITGKKQRLAVTALPYVLLPATKTSQSYGFLQTEPWTEPKALIQLHAESQPRLSWRPDNDKEACG